MTNITSKELYKICDDIQLLGSIKDFFMELPKFDFRDICQAIENLKKVDEDICYLVRAVMSCRFVYSSKPEMLEKLGINGALFYEILQDAREDLKGLTINERATDLSHYVELSNGGMDASYKRYTSYVSDKKFEASMNQYLKAIQISKKSKFVLERIGIKTPV